MVLLSSTVKVEDLRAFVHSTVRHHTRAISPVKLGTLQPIPLDSTLAAISTTARAALQLECNKMDVL